MQYLSGKKRQKFNLTDKRRIGLLGIERKQKAKEENKTLKKYWNPKRRKWCTEQAAGFYAPLAREVFKTFDLNKSNIIHILLMYENNN